jgi:hypothetical protein
MNILLMPLAIINCYVYRFYQRWDGDPVGWTTRLVALFFFINSIMLLKLLGSVSVLVPGNYYALTLPLMALFALVNYLMIFRSNKHLEYFSEIESSTSKSPVIFFWLYLAATIIPVVAMLFYFFTGRH